MIDVSCALAPSSATPDHVVLAERLGFRRAWLYDSPALYADVWVQLARAAERTTAIGLGPAVLVPSLRHPMTNAAAIATLADLAPGRLAVAIGSGFTGRHTLGQRPLRWADVEEYVRVLKALLAGETTTWEGRVVRMLHPPGYGAPRPIDVPILIGAEGPKGTAVAEAVGDGVFAAALPNASATGRWQALLQFGTVLLDGETTTAPRVLDAAGHAVAVAYHGMYERGGPDVVQGLPGGAEWLAALEATPVDERHLHTHEGHLVHLTDRDRAALAAGGSDMIGAFTLSGPPAEVRARVLAFEEAGRHRGGDPAGRPRHPRRAGPLRGCAGTAGSNELTRPIVSAHAFPLSMVKP